MIIIEVAGGVVALAIGLGLVMSLRDRKRGRSERGAGDMWRQYAREQHRDARASVGGQRINPDLRWTEWSRRNHPRA